MNKNFLVIPTNRLVESALDSCIKELNSLSADTINLPTLLIVDNSKPNITEMNRKIINDRKSKFSGKIQYYGAKEISQFLTDLSKKTTISKQEVIELLEPKGVDYGKIFNLIFLIVAANDGVRFFRRDSDCTVLNLPKEGYPINEEIRFLGSALTKFKTHIREVEKHDLKNEDRLMIVGSDYYGDWNMDISDLCQDNPQNLDLFLETLGIPKNAIEQNKEAKFSIENSKKDNWSYQLPILKSSLNIPQYPECGNVGMEEVFLLISNFIGKHGVGFDYTTYFVSLLMKVPILFHYNKIHHMYTQSRRDEASLENYWKGIIKQIDFNYLLGFLIKNEMSNLLKFGQSGLDRLHRISSDELPKAYQRCRDRFESTQRNAIFDRIAMTLLWDSGIVKYRSVSDYLMDNKMAIFNELDQDYKKSIRLQSIWTDLMKAAKSINSKEVP